MYIYIYIYIYIYCYYIYYIIYIYIIYIANFDQFARNSGETTTAYKISTPEN